MPGRIKINRKPAFSFSLQLNEICGDKQTKKFEPKENAILSFFIFPLLEFYTIHICIDKGKIMVQSSIKVLKFKPSLNSLSC